jgi:hypothetical protein
VVTATGLETWAARRVLGGRCRVVRVGVACHRGAPDGAGPVVICGLAGALTPALRRGSVVVPDEVGTPAGGTPARCDPALAGALAAAAGRLGHAPARGRLLTSGRMVVGESRPRWVGAGFEAVDMETALLFGEGRRVAAVRVVIDGPAQELDAAWDRPLAAVLTRGALPQVWGLAAEAPRLALLAALVVRAALDSA